jgi:DNA invertase Pin-like site-specific DNA recombinase
MRVAAYLRVSTDTQAEHGLGLDVQRQAIKTWARQGGHRVVSWWSDEGISGSNGLDTRDALPDAVGEIRGDRAAGLVCVPAGPAGA